MNSLLVFILLFLVIILLFTTLKYKEKFDVGDIICETINNKKDCHSYGCKYLELNMDDIKCTDGISKPPCDAIYFKDDELKKRLEILHSEFNDIKLKKVSDIPDKVKAEFKNNYKIAYIKLAKPNIDITEYINDDNYGAHTIIYEKEECASQTSASTATSETSASTATSETSASTATVCSDTDITKIDKLNNGDAIISKEKKVKVLFVLEKELNDPLKVFTHDYNIDKLLTLDESPIDIKSSIINCYRMGGTEIFENNKVKCEKPKQYNKCVKLNNSGCYHNKNKQACYHDIDCKWENNHCSNKYSIDENNKCLTTPVNDKNDTAACKYYSHLDKYLTNKHNLCNTITENAKCKHPCDWNDYFKECKVKRNIKNMTYNYNNISNLQNRFDNIDNSKMFNNINNIFNDYTDEYLKKKILD